MAYKLAKNHSEEVIAQALSRLKNVTAENPAAYLVAEITRGGYGQPAPDKTKLARLEQEKIHQKRRREREQEAQDKDQSSQRVADNT